MASKATKKFLRMKAYLSRAASPYSLLRYEFKLQDRWDCQALEKSGFVVTKKTGRGTYFDFPFFQDVVKNDLERLL